MNQYIKKALIKSLKDVGIMKFGDFTLRYGVKSDNIYFDFKGLLKYPHIVSWISYELSKFIDGTNCVIAGVPIMGGVAYATILSQIKNIPMILIKKGFKEESQIEGNIENIAKQDFVLS